MWSALNKYWSVNLIVGVLLVNAAALLLLPDWEGFYENTKILLVFCSAFLFFGALLTGLLCCYMTRHHQRISYLMFCPAGAAATVFTMVSGCVVVYGQRLLTSDFWIAVRQHGLAVAGVWLLAFAISVLAALGVVTCYRRWQRDYA